MVVGMRPHVSIAFAAALDLAKLYRMLLDRGRYEGGRILREASIDKMTTVWTGDLKAGFTPGLGMGLGVQVVVAPSGAAEMLSPGSYGHGGAFGTQGRIDPKKGAIYIRMVQRAGMPNGDASALRRRFQSIAAGAVAERS